MAAKSDLSDDIKLFIVEHLACFDSPSVVASAVEKEFGRKVARQTIEAYDPTKVQGRNLSAKLREYFSKVRGSFLHDLDTVAIASKAFRLRMLERMARHLEERSNVLGAAQLLEQAAKEVGGVYVGRGGAIPDDKRLGQNDTEPADAVTDRLAELGESFAKGLRVI